MKRNLFIFASLLLCHITFADTCPSVKDIQHNTLHGWKAFDSDDGTALSAKRNNQFLKEAEEFALAEWVNHPPSSKNKNKGAIHCYYRDKNGSNLEAYLAKNQFGLENNQRFWYQVSGSMQCAAGNEKCQFKTLTLHPQQLAKK